MLKNIFKRFFLIILLFGSCRSFGYLEFFNFQTREKIGSYAVSKESVVKEDVKNAVQALYRQGVEFGIRILGEVEEIGENAFEGCKDLKTVTFEEGSLLKRIGDSAFASTSLVSLEIPSSVEEIGENAFEGCKDLKTVIFEEGSLLKRIGNKAFASTSLVFLEIPSSVKEIRDCAFRDCKDLKTVTFEENSLLETIGYGAFDGTSIESISIPASVEEIGEFAFLECKDLKTVIFEEGSQLKRIGNKAFDGTSIESIFIPASVEEIGEYAFAECNNLKTVTFEENSQLKRIGYGAFYGTSIESISIPASVEEIGGFAFLECKDLKTVIFEEGSLLKRIGNKAFDGTSIESIFIPASVEEIGGFAFLECKDLKTVIFEEGSLLKRIGDRAFASTSLVFLEIPASVERIGNCVFEGTHVTLKIPASIISLVENIDVGCLLITIQNPRTPINILHYGDELLNRYPKTSPVKTWEVSNHGSLREEDLSAISFIFKRIIEMLKTDQTLQDDPILKPHLLQQCLDLFLKNPQEAFLKSISHKEWAKFIRDATQNKLPPEAIDIYSLGMICRMLMGFSYEDIYAELLKECQINFKDMKDLISMLNQENNSVIHLFEIVGKVASLYRSILGEQLPQNSVELAIVKDDPSLLWNKLSEIDPIAKEGIVVNDLIIYNLVNGLVESHINWKSEIHHRIRASLKNQISYCRLFFITELQKVSGLSLLQSAAFWGSPKCIRSLQSNMSKQTWKESIDFSVILLALVGRNADVIELLDQGNVILTKMKGLEDLLIKTALLAGSPDIAREILEYSSGNPQ